MKKQFTLLCFFLFLSFTINANAQNVNVNPGGGSYPTLKGAFDAINAGTHTGAITIDVVGNTTETATAVLNASGTGTASYTSIFMSPSGGARIIEGNLAGGATGSIIRFAGADNVTIDGRIGGTGRNLTVRNNSLLTNQACIFLSTIIPVLGDTNGCQNNVIRNLELSCGADQNSLTTAFLSIGITSGLASTGIGTAARNNDNNQYLDNRIIKVRYGIFLGGGVTFNLNDNNVISGNIIGPDAYGSDQIGKIGIYVNGQNNCLISCNYIQNVGRNDNVAGGTQGADRCGIGLGQENWSTSSTTTLTGTNNVVNANTIINVQETRTFSAVGIICASSAPLNGGISNNLISNNVIYNVRANGTSPDQAVGIGYVGGTATVNCKGDKVVYNSIYMTGLADPPPTDVSTQHTVGVKILSTAASNELTLKNNSIYMDVTSTNTALLHYCISAPSAAYNWTGGGCNNNDYYFPAANTQMRTGGLGTTTPYASSFLTLALWQPVFTTPGPQDGASIQADPLYTLLPTSTPLIPNNGSPLLNAAVPIPGVVLDNYACTSPEIRSGTSPTIGAWEYTSQTLPVELASFNSSVTGRDVTLNWTTATELNNAGFDIERKSTEGSWSKIGNVAGNGTVNTPQNYSFNDRGLSTGKYNYRLKQIDFNGNFEYFNLTNEIGIGIPVKYDLSQNYPNPFNPSTSINYDLPVDGKVSLKIFDMTGKEVASLVNEVQTAGYYSINYNASSLSSGVYFYTISAGNFVQTKKMMLVK
ncbi:MAG TPA: T9SS type A sorting domain-containing protein [Ignavibacteria bacterium]|nr:T9SS type A sorting domain-containing protein [Ignavibacteria bacterium]